MIGQKRKYKTEVGNVVIIEHVDRETKVVSAYEGAMMGDDGKLLDKTFRTMKVSGAEDEEQLREIRHLMKDLVFELFLKTYPEMARGRWLTHVAESVGKIVHKNLVIGARERGLI